MTEDESNPERGKGPPRRTVEDPPVMVKRGGRLTPRGGGAGMTSVFRLPPDPEANRRPRRAMVPGRRFEVGDTPEGELPPPPAKEIDKGYFERVFGYRFEDIEGLHRALTHRSVHTQGERSDYERLEFLGDAVLDLAMAHLLIDAHPAASEGELSKMRAALVNTTTLAEIAREIQLGTFIRLSRGELASGGAERTSILADVMEAVLGALYREGGFEAALASIKHLFGARVVTVLPRDPKTELQEALHALGKEAPKYLLECTEGPEHAPIFISVVQIDGTLAGRGRGTTKKISQQEAAAEALAALKVGDSKVLAKVEAPIGDTDQPVGTSISDGTQRSDGSAVPDRSGPDRSGPDGSGQE